MMRTAFDSDNLGVLVAMDGRADFLMTYADLVGSEALLAQLNGEVKRSQLVYIDRGLGDPLDLATIADIEDRALGVAALPRWVADKKAAGKQWLTGYCDRLNLAAVEAIVRHQIWHFVATLDGTMHIDGWAPMHGPALIQVLGENALGMHADFTVVLEDSWRRGEFERTGAVLDSYGSLAAVLSGDVAALQARCPSWQIEQGLDGIYYASRAGYASLSSDSVIGLAHRIELLYPGSVTP